MRDDELLALLTSLNAWKQDLPDETQAPDTPMLSRDRFLKGYYMVSA